MIGHNLAEPIIPVIPTDLSPVLNAASLKHTLDNLLGVTIRIETGGIDIPEDFAGDIQRGFALGPFRAWGTWSHRRTLHPPRQDFHYIRHGPAVLVAQFIAATK